MSVSTLMWASIANYLPPRVDTNVKLMKRSCTGSRSPRWCTSRGCPRMLPVLLIVLVLENPRRDGSFNVFVKIDEDELLRAPTVGRHNSARVDEGRTS